jgi:peptidoglycan/xylan/chitin deacetylase (PgdA/CDA1 family)
MTATVLMYHAILSGGAPAGADSHYAVSHKDFLSHLETIRARGMTATSVRDILSLRRQIRDCVAMTFDDGHLSNYDAVFPLLVDHRATADFFVNSSTVGLPQHVTWSALREMADAGMSIQSHGHTHRYFEDLRPEEVRDELMRSKAEIENRVGQAVTIFAPPGGRFNRLVGRIARECGYRTLCVSRPGRWRIDSRVIPRMAVLATTPLARVDAWVQGKSPEMGKQVAYYWAKYAVKRLLGNALYDRMRNHLLRPRGKETA